MWRQDAYFQDQFPHKMDIYYKEIFVLCLGVQLYISRHVATTMEIFKTICAPCTKSAIASYKFINKFRENAETLNNLIQDLEYCFTNTTSELSNFKTLYFTIDLDNVTVNCNSQSQSNIRPESKKLAMELKAEQNFEEEKHDGNESRTRRSCDRLKLSEILEDVNNPNDYSCKVCHKTFSSLTNLKQHFMYTHGEKIFKCPDCPRMFSTKAYVDNHRRGAHFYVACSICHKQMQKKSDTLKRHQMCHGQNIIFWIPVGKTKDDQFKVTENFPEVKNKVRSGKIPFMIFPKQKSLQCNDCGKTYTSKHAIQMHIHMKHMPLKVQRHICEYCSKCCASPSQLKAHILKHTKEKNFLCTICNKAFINQQSLRLHTQIHTGEKPFQCEMCGMTFLSSSRRIEHIRGFHMGPTFECDECDKKYKFRVSLHKHKKKHHEESILYY